MTSCRDVVWAFFRRHVPILCTLFFTLLAMAGLQAAYPVLSGQFVETLSKSQARWAICYAAGIGMAAFGSVVLWALHDYCDSLIAEGLGAAVRAELVRHIYSVPLRFLATRQRGEIENLINADIVGLVAKAHAVVVPLLSAALNLTFILTTMFVLDWRMASASILLIPPWFLIQAQNRGRVLSAQKRALMTRDRLSTRIIEFLVTRGMLRSAVYNRRVEDTERFLSIISDSRATGLQLKAIYRAQHSLLFITTAIVSTIVLLIGVYLFVHGLTSVGHIVTFIGFQAAMQYPISVLSGTQLELNSIRTIAARIDSVLDIPTEDRGKGKAQLGSGITAAGIVVSYDGKPVLKDVSFALRQLERVAVIGPSGSGKSTLVLAMQGLIPCDSGILRIGGEEVRELSERSLRTLFAYVGPDDRFFTGTIRENLAYGNPRAETKAMLKACASAGCSDFIQHETALEMRVDASGGGFSSGQLQRLYLARALLRKSDVLILDEATNDLDAEAEVAIFEALRSEARALVIVTHRLASILWADRVVVLNDGRIVEDGSPGSLIAKEGRFWHLLQLQSGAAYLRELARS
jgi:ATP-binding cassette, subfamily B, bacterial